MANIISKLSDLFEDYKKQLLIKKLYETKNWEQPTSKIEKNYTSLWSDDGTNDNKESSVKSNNIFNFDNNGNNQTDDSSWGRLF